MMKEEQCLLEAFPNVASSGGWEEVHTWVILFQAWHKTWGEFGIPHRKGEATKIILKEPATSEQNGFV